MNERYRLGRLRDADLLAAVSRLVAQDRELTADLLAHLGELDERGTCIELGFSSLFAYCTKQLGFCNTSAGMRVTATRVCRKYPAALELVASGALNVTTLMSLSRHLNQDNAEELFAACSHQSTRQVEELLAARFPRPDQADSIRRLPTRKETITPGARCTGEAEVTATVVPAAASGVVGGAHTGGLPVVAEPSCVPEVTSHVVALAAPEVRPLSVPRFEKPARKLEPLSAGRFGVHFTADTEFRDLLEEVRALASYRQPGDLLSLMRAGLEAYRRELERARFKVGKQARAKRPPTAEAGQQSPSTSDSQTPADPAVSDEGTSDEGTSDEGVTVSP